MDLVIAVIFFNLTIAIMVLLIAIWTIRLRRQIVALTNWCDRWASECHLLSTEAPVSIAASRVQIDRLRYLYQQQLLTVDRIRSLGLFIGIARSLLMKR